MKMMIIKKTVKTKTMIDENKFANKYKNRLIEEFSFDSKQSNKQIGRIDVADQIIEDAKELITNAEVLADILITYTESVSDFNTEFEHKGEKHYERLDEVFEEALIIIRDNNLKEKFEERINTMIESSTDWYGQQETLQERKNEYW